MRSRRRARPTATATTHDSLAHVQLAHPADIARIGRDHLYVAYTYSWANVDLDYDMTVDPVPAEDDAATASRPATCRAATTRRTPTRSARCKDAGAILVAGSDAPVDTRDPQPFVNMATRRDAPPSPASRS